MTIAIPTPRSVPARPSDYLAIARFDHSTKHVFILPGILLAITLTRPELSGLPWPITLGLCSAILIASANYVINEWLDRSSDAFHPIKSQRTAVQRSLSPLLVYAEYALFAIAGLLLAKAVGVLFFWTSVAFLVSGITYNVQPIRTKDRTFVDVLTESINNPIRLILGWTMVDNLTLPPSSLLLAYWMGGAFLMAAKRLSEYRDICDNGAAEELSRYRRSFARYSNENLTITCLLYASMSCFFLAVFLIKYRVEYIIVFPFISALFALYFWLALRKGSIAQRPERLFRSRRLVLLSGLTVAAVVFGSLVDMPWLQFLSEPHLVSPVRGS